MPYQKPRYEPLDNSPMTLLRRHLDVSAIEIATELDISTQALYTLEKGGGASLATYLKIEKRWKRELKKLGLEPQHWSNGFVDSIESE